MDETYICVGFVVAICTLLVGFIWRDMQRDKKFMKDIFDHEKRRKS